MQKMICEICGGSIAREADGFTCQSCGMSYSRDAILGMMSGETLAVSGKVAIDNDFSIMGGILDGYRGADVDVVIPPTVLGIGDGAFQNMTTLRSIGIPESVTAIGTGAFRNCVSLESVVIPDSVVSVGASVKGSVVNIGETVMRSAKESDSLFGTLLKTSASVVENVKKMGSGVFQGCSLLRDVRLSESMTTIPANMFADCTVLTMVRIPSGVKAIGRGAFTNCRSLASIDLLKVEYVTPGAFEGCGNLRHIIYAGLHPAVFQGSAYFAAYFGNPVEGRCAFCGSAIKLLGCANPRCPGRQILLEGAKYNLN
jgi:hypothetical protein